jgi:sugar lactone lactonase YvrE
MTQGDAYVIAGTDTAGYSGDLGNEQDALLNSPADVAVDSSDNILVADSGNNVIRIISPVTGTYYGQNLNADDITTLAGSGKQGFYGENYFETEAEMNDPQGVAVGPDGNVYIADSGNNRIRELHNVGNT